MFLFIFIIFLLGQGFLPHFLCASTIEKEVSYRVSNNNFIQTQYVVRLYREPFFEMAWVKLKKGGYMLSGILPDFMNPKINFQAPTCKFLTDMTPEEVLQAVVKEWGYTHRGNIYVKALNAVVELNKEPYLAHPLDLRNNPTEVKEGQKKWIDVKELPRRLYLLCEKGYVNVVNPDPKNYREENYHYLDLYPVKLEIAREGEIKILSVNKVSSSDVEIVFKIYPYVEKALYIDIETLNPKEVALKNCPVAYLGGYLYTGPTPNESYREAPYTPMLSTGPDKRFYLAIFLPDPQDTFKAYLRLDYYCAKTPKTKISLLNPEEGEKSPLQTSYWLNYTHKRYLQKFGFSKIILKLRLISSEGYYSDPFEISLP